MKKVLVFGLGLFLLVFMVGSVNAEILSSSSINSLGEDTDIKEFYLESDEPINCNYGRCFLHSGSVSYWEGQDKIFVGNFTLEYQGVSTGGEIEERLYVGGVYGKINFTIYDDFYEGDLRGVSIKNFFEDFDISEIDDFNIMNRSLHYDSLYWETGYVIFEELIKNGNEIVDGEIILTSSYDGGYDETPPKYSYEHMIILKDNFLEQRILKIEDDLFDEQNGSLVATFYDEYGCEVYNAEIMDSEKTKDKIKQLKRSSCRNKAKISEIINDFISNIWDAINGIEVIDYSETLENHDSRLMILETGSSEIFPSYLNKLSSSYRKKIVCAYGEENHLVGVQGLGWNCGFTYKTSRGRESVRCLCKRM